MGPGAATGFRPELQGLRALAVVLVVVYHVWVGRVSGGVDVFFVVSGFLLTGQLVRAADRGDLDVRRRWTRSLARLVPAAAVVLVVTAVAAALVLPEGRWSQTVREIVAAALMVAATTMGNRNREVIWRNSGDQGQKVAIEDRLTTISP